MSTEVLLCSWMHSKHLGQFLEQLLFFQLINRVTLCNTMDCSMPGFPALHDLPEFPQTDVHGVSDVI